jgi:hypothetical protein
MTANNETNKLHTKDVHGGAAAPASKERKF